MKSDSNILVTGGAGYIGSHVCKKLSLTGYNPITYDNLSRGNESSVQWGPIELGDLLDYNFIKKVLLKYNPLAVIHLAGLAYVRESVKSPLLYYQNNCTGSLNLFRAMFELKLNNIVFSSSCSTYGIPKKVPIPDNYPQNPINPYGQTKLMIEKILRDIYYAHSIKSISLRYFNAAGADPDCQIGEIHVPETHLIPRILNVAIGREKELTIYGNNYNTHDGYCIRDYVHVDDLAEAHVLALEYLIDNDSFINGINLGTGYGYSVMDVIKAAENLTGEMINYTISDNISADPPVLIANSERAKKYLHWTPKRSELNEQIQDAWKWHQKYFI